MRAHDPGATGEARRAEYQPDVASGLELVAPRTPSASGATGVDYLGRQWCVHPDLGRQWCVHPDLGREVALAPGTRLDLRLERGWRLRPPAAAPRLPHTLSGVLALDNAANARIYDQCGLPQPGRTLRLRLELR